MDKSTQDLFEAIRRKNLKGVKDAVANGADITAQDPNFNARYRRYSVITYSLFNSTEEITNYLLSLKPDLSDDNILTYFFKDNKIIDKLVELGADINRKDSHGRTILHNYVDEGIADLNLFKRFLKNGANPNIKDEFGRTVLTFFIDKIYEQPVFDQVFNMSKFVQIFLENGADPNIIDEYSGQNALCIIMKRGIFNFDYAPGYMKNLKKSIQLLLQYGTNINSKTRSGKTAYELVTESYDSLMTHFKKDPEYYEKEPGEMEALRALGDVHKYIEQCSMNPEFIKLIKLGDEVTEYIRLYSKLSLVNRTYYSLAAQILPKLKEIKQVIAGDIITNGNSNKFKSYLEFLRGLKHDMVGLVDIGHLSYVPMRNVPKSNSTKKSTNRNASANNKGKAKEISTRKTASTTRNITRPTISSLKKSITRNNTRKSTKKNNSTKRWKY
jgi:hypothetical protein